jgi:hypothetical protein
MHLAQDRDQWQAVVDKVMNPWVPYMAKCFSTTQVIISLSRRTLLHGISYLINFMFLQI